MAIEKKINIDLYQYPTEKAIRSANSQVTLGDLDGNFVKFLHQLVGRYLWSSKSYLGLFDLYLEPTLSKEQIEKFNLFLADVGLFNPVRLRLIGDELADRGVNDYFILKLLERLTG